MEGIRKKLLFGLITLAIVLIASVVLWAVIASYEYQGIANTNPWTPLPGLTSTITIVADDLQPTLTSTFYTSPTNTKDPAKDCTHSTAYWEGHPEVWPSNVTIANLSYTKDEITIVIETQSNDVAAVLFIQLHTAFLNAVSGADYGDVYNTIIDAANWLSLHPVGSQISQPDQQTAISFVKILEDYNEGRLGPGHCIGDATPIPAESTSLPTVTVSFNATLMATRTPIFIMVPTQPHPHVPPKKTNTPPPHPPTQAPPPPTSIPQPTQAPPPTSVPQPTRAPTSPPNPTKAPTLPGG